MHLKILFVLFLAHAYADEEVEKIEENYAFTRVEPKQGNVCNVNQSPTIGDYRNQYYECRIPTVEGGEWIWDQLGIWVLENCTQGSLFDAQSGNCKNFTTGVRRTSPYNYGPYQAGGYASGGYGQPTPQQGYQSNFGQRYGGGCGGPQVPIGPCGSRQRCPGQSVCQPETNMCCQEPVRPVQPVGPISSYGSGCQFPEIPVGSCGSQSGCPGQSVCQQQTNTCCQQPWVPQVEPTQPVVPNYGCPSSEIPVGSCGSRSTCPQQATCQPQTNVCCQKPVQTVAPYVPPTYGCRNLEVPVGRCGSQSACPPPAVCQPETNTCCEQPYRPVEPIQPVFPSYGCKSPEVPVGQCGSQSTCPGQSVCQQETNTCCQQPYRPVEPIQPVIPSYGCRSPEVPVGQCGSQSACPGQSVCQQETNTCCQQPYRPVQPTVDPCADQEPSYPSCPVVKKPCPNPSGGLCSWMLAPLKSGQGNGYLQCAPAKGVHEYCGRWLPRKCAYGTKFNVQAQVCVWDPRATPRPQRPRCPNQQIPLGPCSSQQTCPGQATCQRPTNVCCQQSQWDLQKQPYQG